MIESLLRLNLILICNNPHLIFYQYRDKTQNLNPTDQRSDTCNNTMSHSHEHSHAEHFDVDHNHSHSHNNHDDHHAAKSAVATEKEKRQQVLKKLKTASILCLVFLLVEVVGGILAGSLAVLSDAAHLAADLSAFVVAIVGSHIASLPASDAHTFGLKRTESLAALFSMASLLVRVYSDISIRTSSGDKLDCN